MQNLELIILLLTAITLFAVLAEKIKFPFPILLVLIGLIISFIPALPVIELNPDLVFLIFLPPLLYSAAWNTSWHDFRANLRSITLAAVGMVFFTTFLVAVAAHYFIPGMGWPEAFVLGAIVSPPDAVAATTVTKGLGLHKRVITLLEGESLVNDASGLIAYRYGIAAVATGNFIFWKAGLEFLWVVMAGLAVGLIFGFILFLVHKYITGDPIIETTLTFLTPYSAYLVAEHFHISGVLAVVACGLYLTYRSGEIFSHATRMTAQSVWETVEFIFNGIIFILIGLQLKHVVNQIGDHSLGEMMVYGLIISLVVMIVRFIWVFPAAYIPRFVSKGIRAKEVFSYKNVIVFSWAGMRGVVSMAAALAIPFTINDNVPFPNRDVILFITFSVVIVTLVFQGTSLPFLIKLLRIPHYSVVDEEQNIRLKVASASIVHIEENFAFGKVSDEVLAQIKSKYEIKINRLRQTDLVDLQDKHLSPAQIIFNQYNEMQGELISVERNLIKQLRKEGKSNEEILRKIEHELDLEEARLEYDRYQE